MCRATAVFSPENEKSNGASRGPVSPRGKAIAAASPSRATRSMCGPPGNAEQPRDLVERPTGRVVDRGAERGDGAGHIRDVEQARVPARDQQRQARRQRAVLQRVDSDVRGQVVDPVEGHIPRGRVRLGGGDSDQ